MPLIEKISQMQRQGLSNEEIIQRLKEEGISPRDINEGLTQSQVKSAVSGDIPRNATRGMEPSVMTPEAPAAPPTPTAPPAPEPYPQQIQPQEPSPTGASEEMPVPQPTPETALTSPLTQEVTPAYPPEEEYPAYSAFEYPEYQYPTPPLDTEIITEIAEQIVAEKIEKLQKQISEAIKFKTETGGKVDNIDDRLKRIERTIHALQTAILNKIGEYGKNISDLKQEMISTQESFSKILGPLSESTRERKTTKTKSRKKTETKRGKKKKDGFESYLRR